jgi:hypothetical protein
MVNTTLEKEEEIQKQLFKVGEVEGVGLINEEQRRDM